MSFIQATFNTPQNISGYNLVSNPNSPPYVYFSILNPTSIPPTAFNSYSLISISIPSSVTSIDSTAFQNCIGLTSITVNSSNPNYSSDLFGVLYNKGQTQLILCSPGFIGAYTILSSVTSIGDNAFFSCPGLMSIIISQFVTSIGNYAFSNCPGLTAVTIPASVTSIGDSAFQGCTRLTSVSLPFGITLGTNAFPSATTIRYYGVDTSVIQATFNAPQPSLAGYTFVSSANPTNWVYVSNANPTSIKTSAFQNNTNLISITIPSSITSIGDYAFALCTGLTSITIPSSVTSIGIQVFQNCTGLTSITIPSSVTSIGIQAFQNCTGLSSITVNLSNSNYSSDSFGVLYNYGKTQLILCPPKFTGTYTIPISVTSIEDSAFAGCILLTSVTIPSTCTSIGDSAFANCAGLTTVTILSSVTSIGNNTFAGCILLTSVTIPSTCTSIGDSAFVSCIGLTAVTIPSTCTSIGNNTFANCNRLTTVTIPASVNSIGNNTFQSCTGLTAVTIPSSVTSIGNNTFANCNRLTTVTIPSSVTSIGGAAFQGTGLTSVSLPFGITLGTDAFPSATTIRYYGGNTSIQATFNAVKNISGYTLFSNPDAPPYVYVSNDNPTSIPPVAFSSPNLISIIIPSSVTSIDSNAFQNCTELTSITVNSNNPNYSSDSQGALYNKGQTQLILCPPGFTGAYTIQNTCTSISNNAFNINNYVDNNWDGVFIIELFGCKGLTAVTIPASVTSIGDSAFYNCTGLTAVTIPSSVTSIGDSAFQGTGLTLVSLPFGITLGTDAFLSETAIAITYYGGDTSIQATFNAPQPSLAGYTLFSNPDETPYVYVSDVNPTSIPSAAFNSSLVSINIPSNVANITAGAFLGCTALTSITVDPISTYYITDSQGTLYNYGKTTLLAFPPGFKGTYNAIPATCTSIAVSAFQGTIGLTGITIPTTCTNIGASAFLGTGLKAVTLSSGTTYNLTNSFPSSTKLSIYDTSSSSSSSSAYSASLTTPISTICFPAKTPINTDQGIIPIEKIHPKIHTINNKKITAITQTISLENYLVCFEKHSLGRNYPSQKTEMSAYHKINYKGKLIEAKKFINKREHVKKIKYTGEILYNVLMETHDKMVVNNLSVETLHPNNIIAKLYTSNYTETNKNDIIILMNDCIKKNDLVTYKKIIDKF